MAIRVERRMEGAEPDTAFLRLAQDLEPMLSSAERSYVVLRTRSRDAVSAPVGALLESGDPAGDVLLRDGDRVVVPRLLPMISVQGEVRAPGLVPLRDKGRVEDYIEAAGGFTSHAMKSRTRVTLAATGRQVGSGDTGVLHAGDTIWVPAKPERNPWSTIRDIVGVTAAAAAIVLAVEAVNN
jgi:protein involved in polysaccharide export with SLBB domain